MSVKDKVEAMHHVMRILSYPGGSDILDLD